MTKFWTNVSANPGVSYGLDLQEWTHLVIHSTFIHEVTSVVLITVNTVIAVIAGPKLEHKYISSLNISILDNYQLSKRHYLVS